MEEPALHFSSIHPLELRNELGGNKNNLWEENPYLSEYLVGEWGESKVRE
jgi:hypothetical protein